MAKHHYMVNQHYVDGWNVKHALREVIANGFDAEIEQGAKFSLTHEKGRLVAVNDGTKLPIDALYYGGTSKRGKAELVGQFGEGLKLALLVFARENIDIRIVNNDEVWTCGFETDTNGKEAFHIYMRAISPKGEVRVEVPGVGDELWDEIQTWFLRLSPPRDCINTEVGTLLLDWDHIGQRYAKGVYIDVTAKTGFGYDFKHLDVGRDRRSYRQGDADYYIGKMWDTASKSDDAMERLFRALQQDTKDLSMLYLYGSTALASAQARLSHEDYGGDAYPVSSAGEGVELEHIGVKPITLPRCLVDVLRAAMPSIEDVKAEKAREVTYRYTSGHLTEQEGKILRRIIEIGRHIGIKRLPSIVDFRSESLEGIYSNGEIFLARKTLKTFGKALGVYIHEAAHEAGDDAHVGHVDQIHHYMEAAFEVLGAESPIAAGAVIKNPSS